MILLKFLTKIKPEVTCCFPNENYKMTENDARFLGDVRNDHISVTENQRLSFNETGNLELSLHGKEDYIGMVTLTFLVEQMILK